MSATTDIVDEAERGRFVYREDGVEAELSYRLNGNRLVLMHTEVPEELGGRGVGGRLVRAAARRAAETGETIVPLCPFTRSWLERHPDEADGLSIDWTPPPSQDSNA